MSDSAQRFVALLAGILTAVALTGGGLRMLWLISWRLSQLVERFDNHLEADDEFRRETKERVTSLERARQGRRP